MTAPELPAPPSGLSAEAEALWVGYLSELDEDDRDPDARELAVLAEACKHLTLAGRLEVALADLDDVVVQGSRNNLRVTPLVPEIDRVRKTVATLLKSIAHVDRAAVNSANSAARWARR